MKGYKETFVNPIDDYYLYYQLWRQIPDDYREKLIGTNKPKTRNEIVRAIEEIEIDRKRDRSKSDAAAQSESKRSKTSYKPPYHSSRNDPKQSKGTEGGPTASKDGFKPEKDSCSSSTCYSCNYCKSDTYSYKDC